MPHATPLGPSMQGIGTIALGLWNARPLVFTHPLPMVATVILGMLCVHLL